MKTLTELVEMTVIVVVLLGLYFLFDGTPNVWDSLRAAAMGACKP